jgi:hypothetical protein
LSPSPLEEIEEIEETLAPLEVGRTDGERRKHFFYSYFAVKG